MPRSRPRSRPRRRRTSVRENPRHADVILASIEAVYSLPYRQAPVARFIVVPGKRPRASAALPSLLDVLPVVAFSASTKAAVGRDAAMLAPGHYVVYEVRGQDLVASAPLEVEA